MGINLKSQNIKIYAIILLASLFVVLLGLNSYNNAKESQKLGSPTSNIFYQLYTEIFKNLFLP